MSRIKDDDYASLGDDLIKNISEVSIYVNGKCNLSCPLCGDYYLQTLFCTKSSSILNVSQVYNVLNKLSSPLLRRINILGGDLLLYHQLGELTCLLAEYNIETNFYFHYRNINSKVDLFHEFVNQNPNGNINIQINYPETDNISKFIIKNKYVKSSLKFVIESIDEYNRCMELVEKHDLDNYDIIPILTKYNVSFFFEYVAFRKIDILNSTLSKREIFARQVTNTTDFGKLTIKSDGLIFSNLNHEKLCSIRDNIKEGIIKELKCERGWLGTRKFTKCEACLYKHLCPPVSNYEYILNQPLCK